MKTKCKYCGFETPSTHRDICGVCSILKQKPNNSNDWRETTQLLIRKYLYIDPNSLDHWKQLAKMMGENCKVCGKPLVPNEYADEFENKLLSLISSELQREREKVLEEVNEMIKETSRINRIKKTKVDYYTAYLMTNLDGGKSAMEYALLGFILFAIIFTIVCKFYF